jgi:hypothetical protein
MQASMRSSILIIVLLAFLASCGVLANTATPVATSFQPDLATEGTARPSNALQGLYRWNGQEIAPLTYPTSDSYARYTWRELEPSPGNYDFSPIERAISEASSKQQHHAFRVRAMVNQQGLAVPDYLVEQMEAGWWGDANNDGKNDTYIPDWNDPDFQERLNKLIQQLGQRYNGDPRIAWVDVGLYGNWGEWHIWPFHEGYPQPGGAAKATEESKQQIIDAMAQAFDRTQLLMGTEDLTSLLYALRTYPTMGWRRDSLGDPHFTEGSSIRRLREDPEGWSLFTERWKTAPVIVEFISPNDQVDPQVYEMAHKQAQEFHVSMIGNGNTLPWETLSEQGRKAFLQLHTEIGYRYHLTNLTLPLPLLPGKSVTISTDWQNLGNAPTYESWEIVYQLRAQDRQTIVWEATSSLDLRKLLPGTESQRWEDTVNIPAALSSGSYDLVLLVRDPIEKRAPMALLMNNLQADRSYRIGTITVVS